MSDVSQGPGWWQASDGKWYAPELHPDYQPPTEAVAPTPPDPPQEPPPEPAPTQAAPVTPEPTQAIPTAAPIEPTQMIPTPPPVGPPAGPPLGAAGPVVPPPSAGGGKGKLIAALVVVAALLAGLLLFLLNRDDDKKVATNSSSSSSSASSSKSSSSRSSSSRSSSSRSSSVSSSALLSSASAAAQAALLVPSDVGPDFEEQSYSPSSSDGICGDPSPDSTVEPPVLVGTRLMNLDGISVIEEIRAYNNLSDAKKAYTLARNGVDCSEASLGGTTYAVDAPTDVASDINADQAFAVSLTSDEGELGVVWARQGNNVVLLQFFGPTGSDTTVVDTLSVSQTAVSNLK